MRQQPQSFPALVILLYGLIAVVGGESPAISQSAVVPEVDDPGANEPFFEAVDVEIVNIDVWVTDKKGNPVDGLDRDDFVVFRDGQPVEVTNFYAVFDGRPVASKVPKIAGPDAEDTLGDSLRRLPSSPLEVAPEHRLWLIVYIDNYNIDPTERKRILPALRQFLARTLRRGDQAMLISYNRSLKVHQPFTDDRHLLFAALKEVSDYAGHAVARERDQIAAFELIDRTQVPSQALSYARQYAEELMNGVDYTVDALKRLVDSLGGLPGRKALIHVSSGVPMVAGASLSGTSSWLPRCFPVLGHKCVLDSVS